MTAPAGSDGPSAAIRIPATPEALALVRLFASAIGRQAELAEEDQEDLKLALTEVCSAAIEASTGHGDITVEIGWGAEPGDLEAHVVASARFAMGDPESSDRAGLLDALGLELRSTDDGHGVAFAASIGAST